MKGGIDWSGSFMSNLNERSPGNEPQLAYFPRRGGG